MLDDFDDNYPIVSHKLSTLLQKDFVVITVREGSRGVDFKGKDNAYVLICLEGITLS